ncbi:hypothetical protein [Comamonas testosteroni]|uniref:hypothetical protein n=1 Tax=Comamonas testosteroni TaxID=285 RepID=UPI0005B39A5A|nr:hypothetical protein [Comamonas testosteroni]
MSTLSISVLAFVFVISIWALVPGLVIKFVHSKFFAKALNFVLTVSYGGLGWDAFVKFGLAQYAGCLVTLAAAIVVYSVQDKLFGK